MKTLLSIIITGILFGLGTIKVFADDTIGTIHRTNGEAIETQAYNNIWPVQFKVKKDAENIASGLENGQVFQDQDTHLYQVWYGNCKITGMVVVSSISQN